MKKPEVENLVAFSLEVNDAIPINPPKVLVGCLLFIAWQPAVRNYSRGRIKDMVSHTVLQIKKNALKGQTWENCCR